MYINLCIIYIFKKRSNGSVNIIMWWLCLYYYTFCIIFLMCCDVVLRMISANLRSVCREYIPIYHLCELCTCVMCLFADIIIHTIYTYKSRNSTPFCPGLGKEESREKVIRIKIINKCLFVDDVFILFFLHFALSCACSHW